MPLKLLYVHICDVFHVFFITPSLTLIFDIDPSQDLIKYKMSWHEFGYSTSPDVATLGKCVFEAEDDVVIFKLVVDDCLM